MSRDGQRATGNADQKFRGEVRLEDKAVQDMCKDIWR